MVEYGPDEIFFKVPQCYPSVHKTNKCFDHTFTFDAPIVWNDLPDDVHSASNPVCLRKKVKPYVFKRLPTLGHKLPSASVISI